MVLNTNTHGWWIYPHGWDPPALKSNPALQSPTAPGQGDPRWTPEPQNSSLSSHTSHRQHFGGIFSFCHKYFWCWAWARKGSSAGATGWGRGGWTVTKSWANLRNHFPNCQTQGKSFLLDVVKGKWAFKCCTLCFGHIRGILSGHWRSSVQFHV